MPIPRDAHDAIFLSHKVAICTSKAIHIVKPMKWVRSCDKIGRDLTIDQSVTASPIVVPNLLDTTRGASTSLQVLREKCDLAKILGLVIFERNMILIVYDGQYITSSFVFPPYIYLFIPQNLVVTLTITAYLSVQPVIFPGSAKLQRMLIVEPTSCFSRPNLSRCAALLLESSFR